MFVEMEKYVQQTALTITYQWGKKNYARELHDFRLLGSSKILISDIFWVIIVNLDKLISSGQFSKYFGRKYRSWRI